MRIKQAGIQFSVLTIVFYAMVGFACAADEKPPELQVVVFVSDGSFSCHWCDKFKEEAEAAWKKQGWPVGEKETDSIRVIPRATGPVPIIKIVRKGKVVASHEGYSDYYKFNRFVKKYIPEWWEAPKQPVKTNKAVPKAWDYDTELLLGD